MARSAHAFVRGSTASFYECLATSNALKVPEGPAIWICGDCHAGNLGPIANAKGDIDVQIRDLDQTVVGNPAHDLIRLGLSQATAARGSDLPGVSTAQMLEQIIEGYEHTLSKSNADGELHIEQPEVVQNAMRRAIDRRWKHLEKERIENGSRTIPLGKRFWPLSGSEKVSLKKLFTDEEVRHLVTSLDHREGEGAVTILDAAFWVKGCSSLGRLRYAVLLQQGGKKGKRRFIDIKEAIDPMAPVQQGRKIPKHNAERVVEGARHLSPALGSRMLAKRLLGRSVFIRELLPQDLKFEIEYLSRDEAMKVAKFLAAVVGKAHARQMDAEAREAWLRELSSRRSKTLDAPSWLWSNVVELVAQHERAYLEHCRKYALSIPRV